MGVSVGRRVGPVGRFEGCPVGWLEGWEEGLINLVGLDVGWLVGLVGFKVGCEEG